MISVPWARGEGIAKWLFFAQDIPLQLSPNYESSKFTSDAKVSFHHRAHQQAALLTRQASYQGLDGVLGGPCGCYLAQ